MFQVIIRRLLWFIPVFFVVTGITFVTMHALPGGPFDSDKTPPALVAQMEATFGLSKPIHEQYFIWLSNVVRLRFGPSLVARGKPVESFLLPALWVSMQLGLLALLFALCVGLPAGIIAAMKRGAWQDRTTMFVAILGVSIPAIVLGPMLYWLFSLQLGWLPVAKWGDIERWTLVLHQPRHPAGHHAGRGAVGHHRAADTRQPVASAGRGLRAHGPLQGLVSTCRDRAPCAAQFADSGRDLHGSAGRGGA